MNIAVIAGAIALWGAIHSWLASIRTKAVIRRILGEQLGRTYRLAYNAFAVLSFLPILWLVHVLPDKTLYFVGEPWRYLMLAIEGVAAVMLVIALLATDSLEFAGVRQVLEGETSSRLVTAGFYRWVRHPLYLFGLLIIWFTPLMTANLLVVVVSLTVYLVVGAWLEEKKLLREFGADYQVYRASTPMFIPGLRPRRTAAEIPAQRKQK